MDTEKQMKRIHNLFLRLAAMYGHVWRSLYKSEGFLTFTKNEWLEGLKKFEDKILDSALQYCLQKLEYPPTLPQFIECCKTHSKQGQYEKPITETKGATPRIARMELNNMRAMLNMPLRQEEN
jgi:hypothetical protein